MWSGNMKVKYVILIFKDWRGTRLRVIYTDSGNRGGETWLGSKSI